MLDMKPGAIIKTALVAGLSLLIITLACPAGAWSPAAVSIAASNSTSVALLDDGTVWQWGYGPGSAWSTPHQVGISGVRHISAGYGHVLALKSDGTVWAWGSNEHGQLGDGTRQDSAEPVRANIGGVTAIAAGKDHSLALKSDGTVWAWGYNAYGQLGDGSRNYTGSAVPIQVNGLNDIKAISTGGSHCLALQGNGMIWAWGENSHGILGDGTNESRFVPVKSKISDVKSFDAGTSHALAVKSDDSVWAWGYNYMGQLGMGGASLNDQGRISFGPEADNYNPDIVRGISDAKAVAAGGSHSIALKSDGTVWAWGSNEDGQLGTGATGGNDRTSPVQVKGMDGATAVAAGLYHTLALKSDGSVWAWGSNEFGQVGNDSASSTASPVLVLMGSQIPPPASPTPIIATVPPATAAPEPANVNYLLIGAVGLLAVILAVIVAAYLLVFRKNVKKEKGKKGL
jgi:alpha-tubulin suppressor-like RCC1 family protein